MRKIFIFMVQPKEELRVLAVCMWRAKKAGSGRDQEVSLEDDTSGSAETQRHMFRTVTLSAELLATRVTTVMRREA